jgi:hypothetical protein
MKYLAKFLLLGWFAVGMASSCTALIINGAENASAPASDPGWSYVGQLNGASCVYLGNGWVLTAGHVGEGTVSLNGTAYQPDPSIQPVSFPRPRAAPRAQIWRCSAYGRLRRVWAH